MPRTIPIIETRGTHYQVGHQIGVAAREALRAMYAEVRAEYPDKWQSLRAASIPFLELTQMHLPNVLEEMRGCADGAQLEFQDLFLMSVEELLYEEVRGATSPQPSPYKGEGATSSLPSPLQREGATSQQHSFHNGVAHLPCSAPLANENVSPLLAKERVRERLKGCSDLAAAPPATRDGHVWLAHNNDLGKSAVNQLFVTHFRVEGEPEILAVTVGGLFISIGLNNAGISLTGNQLNATDSRAGVPRLLIVRDILAQTKLEDALASALLNERASSYNNIIASRDERIVNVEGSATAAALSWSAENAGTLAHTNHYLDPAMRALEADGKNVSMSATRCARAFDYAQKYRGQVDFAVCARFVRDHVYAPWSVCKHAGQSVTVFSSLIDLTEQKLWLTRGNPCQSEFELYSFES